MSPEFAHLDIICLLPNKKKDETFSISKGKDPMNEKIGNVLVLFFLFIPRFLYEPTLFKFKVSINIEKCNFGNIKTINTGQNTLKFCYRSVVK